MNRVLYILFVLFLCLPIINQVTGKVFIKKLEGYVPDSKDTIVYNWENFMEGKIQEKFDSLLFQKINSIPAYVRFRNYFDYKLFDQVHAQNVVKGENDYLYYITDYYLNESKYISYEKIMDNVSKFGEIQKKLIKEGKTVLLVIEPEKMYIYPEYLPQGYQLTDTVRMTYDRYVEQLKYHGVEYINFNEWFIKLKKDNKYALFARGGKHWTHYYATTAFDSVGDYLRFKGHKVPDFEKIEAKMDGNPWGEDIDTWKAANLPFYYEENNIPNVDYSVKTGDKEKVLIIGDSYFHTITWSGEFQAQFEEGSEFWYYNRERFSTNNEYLGLASQEAFDELDVDTYIIFVSVGNLSWFDYGFTNYFEEK